MIRVVLDTNVVVSAALIDEGWTSAIFDLATNKQILMLISPAILAEYEKVLHYPVSSSILPASTASSRTSAKPAPSSRQASL